MAITDFRGYGPPGDIGNYVLPVSAVVFQFTFSGTTYTGAIRTHDQGWVMISYGTVPETVINAAFTTLGAGARVMLLDNTYTLQAAGITFSNNNQVLEGQGRGTFIDGDALATTVHAINISGVLMCQVKNLAVQTEDGGGKTCHCIYIEDGADNFHLENLWLIDSDDDGIHIEGTDIDNGWIINCKILGVDGDGIFVDMDQDNYLDFLIVIGCLTTVNGGDGFLLNDIRYSELTGNIITGCSGDGVQITASEEVVFGNNIVSENGLHGLNLNSPNCTAADNTFFDNSQDDVGVYHGIYLGASADRCLLNGNFCNSPGDSQEDGINLASGCDYVSIVGNYCYNGMGDGIDLVDCDYCLIKSNYCLDNDDFGVRIQAGTLNIVDNNYLLDNGGGSISDGGTFTRVPEVNVLVPNPDARIGTHQGAQMLDGVATIVGMEVPVPLLFQELVSAQVVVVQTADAANGSIVWVVDTNYGRVCDSEDYNTEVDAVGATTVITQNDLECLDVSDALTNVDYGDLVGLEITRDGAVAGDTLNGPCYVIGVRIRYV